MASCLWMYLCFLGAIFTFVATEDIDGNITCTFTSGEDCSHLLNLNNTVEYVIETEAINRTGVKIIFDTERAVEFLRISSGKELAHKVQVINITRGKLIHLVNLSCSKESQTDEIKLEPVVVSKELQIDFVKGCGNDTDPIAIKSMHYTFEIDEEELSSNASQRNPSSEKPLRKEETQTPGAGISAELGHATWIPILTDQHRTEPEKPAEPTPEESTVPTSSVAPTKKMKTIPKTSFTKKTLIIAAEPTKVNKKNETEKNPDNKINFKFDASKSSARKVSSDLANLFLVLFLLYNA